MDADALPGPLNTQEIRQAMEVLKMLAQNDLERELYEGRLKAKRDLQTLETQRQTLETQRQALEVSRDQWQQRHAEAEQRLDKMAGERDKASRERDAARHAARNALVERIQLCERLLKRSRSSAEDLASRDVEELRNVADRLDRELTESQE